MSLCHLLLRRLLLALLGTTLLCATGFISVFTLPIHASPLLIKQQQKAQTACPILQLDSSLLAFCSPSYRSNISGPLGSHVVVAGNNLPAPPNSLIIINKDLPQDLNTLGQCMVGKISNCFPLPTPKKTNFSLSFTWTFQVKPGDYLIVADVGGTIFTSSPTFTFTLLSSPPPCIVAENDNPSTIDCSQPQELSFIAGSPFTLHGSHWQLGNDPNNGHVARQTVTLTITCTPTQSNEQAQSYSFKAQPDTEGKFVLQIPSLLDVDETCAITASNKVNDGDSNTLADGALTFGETGDVTKLTINMHRPEPSPTPIPSPTILIVHNPPSPIPNPIFQTLDMLSLLAMLPAVFALLLFIVLLVYQPALPGVAKTAMQNEPPEQPLAPQPQDKGDESTPYDETPYLLATIKLYDRLPNPIAGNKINIEEAQINAALQALEQGNPNDVIQLATAAFLSHFDTWVRLLQATRDTGGGLDRSKIELQASTAFTALRTFVDTQNVTQYNTAIVLYSQVIPYLPLYTSNTANIYYHLGIAYSYLSFINSKLTIALSNKESWYEFALDIYKMKINLKHLQIATQHNIGCDYLNNSLLPDKDPDKDKDPKEQVMLAIKAYNAALALCNPQCFPEIWRAIQCHLGYAHFRNYQLQKKNEKTWFDNILHYFYKITGRGPRKLLKAISYYQRALDSYEASEQNSQEYAELYICLGLADKERYDVSHKKKFLLRASDYYDSALNFYLSHGQHHWYKLKVEEDNKVIKELLNNLPKNNSQKA